MAKRPNILIMFSDQHNAKVMGHKGHPDVQTPNMDRLAREGVRFDNAITQNPICTPSRTSFLSGQYCHNHGYYGLSGPHPGGLPNLFGYFRQAGYATSAVGKIHCPAHWIEKSCEFFHETCFASVEGRSQAYTQFLQDCGKQDLEDHKQMPEYGDQGTQSMEGRPSSISYEESQEGWISAQTIQYMDSALAEGRPFLAFASLPRPHQCTSPSEPFWSMYQGRDLTLPPNADNPPTHRAPHFQATVARWRTGDWSLIEPKTFEAARLRKLQGYLGAVSQVDHAMGQMLDYLDQKGIAEDTIVIYTTDHGEYATEHGIMEKAPGICSDAVTRVPLLWRWPGMIKAGHVVEELAESVDVSTTLCRLAGLPLLETSDGLDLSHLLRGESGEVRDIAVTELAWSKSVRKGKYRLVYYPREMFLEEHPGGFGELYDLEADLWEMNNLYFDTTYADIVRELEQDLLNWLVTTNRPTTTIGAHFTQSPQLISAFRCKVNSDRKFHPDRLRAARSKDYL